MVSRKIEWHFSVTALLEYFDSFSGMINKLILQKSILFFHLDYHPLHMVIFVIPVSLELLLVLYK